MASILLSGSLRVAFIMAHVVFIDFFRGEHFNPGGVNNINYVAHIVIIGLGFD